MPWTSPLLYEIVDTAADFVDVDVLQQQIEGAGITQPLDHIDAQQQPAPVGAIQVHFVDTAPDAITDANKAIVDAAVAAHTGGIALEFRASATIVALPVQPIIQNLTWETLGGVVTNPQFFVPDLTKALGQIQGTSQAVGATAELRVVERSLADSSEVVVAEATIAASVTMEALVFQSTVAPRPGPNEYRLEGRLNGAVSAAVGFVSYGLFQVQPVGISPAT